MKLHLGCGLGRIDGWINIDIVPGPNVDLVCDLLQDLPYDDNSIDLIFCEHTLEHFTLAEGRKLLCKCSRVLKPTGRMRIGVPGLERCLKHYHDNTWQQECWVTTPDANINSRTQYINAYFRYWQHKFIYDEGELINAMLESGFQTARRQPHHTSDCPELCHLEVRSAEYTDLIVEGIK